MSVISLIEEANERLTALDVEIREFREQGRVALDYKDIQARYGVGVVNARDIIRGIKSVCGGGKLPAGKVLPSEVKYWESLVDQRKVRL
jgi:hypothetical protein